MASNLFESMPAESPHPDGPAWCKVTAGGLELQRQTGALRGLTDDEMARKGWFRTIKEAQAQYEAKVRAKTAKKTRP